MNERLKNNIDREAERNQSKDAEPLKEKYGSQSHTRNVNGSDPHDRPHDPSLVHEEDLKSSEAPLLDRRKDKEQRVEVKNKSHLNEKEG